MKSLLQQFSDNNFLITTSQWFTCPDGKMYRTVWGKVEIYNSESTLGVKTNVRSTNWYAIVGKGDKRVIVAGCQIHYACVCMSKPFTGNVTELKFSESLGHVFEYERENIIYLAQ